MLHIYSPLKCSHAASAHHIPKSDVSLFLSSDASHFLLHFITNIAHNRMFHMPRFIKCFRFVMVFPLLSTKCTTYATPIN